MRAHEHMFAAESLFLGSTAHYTPLIAANEDKWAEKKLTPLSKGATLGFVRKI